MSTEEVNLAWAGADWWCQRAAVGDHGIPHLQGSDDHVISVSAVNISSGVLTAWQMRPTAYRRNARSLRYRQAFEGARVCPDAATSATAWSSTSKKKQPRYGEYDW
jgi:hypothetical protein